MSIYRGNNAFRQQEYELAIQEYRCVAPDDAMYHQAQLNIYLTERRLKNQEMAGKWANSSGISSRPDPNSFRQTPDSSKSDDVDEMYPLAQHNIELIKNTVGDEYSSLLPKASAVDEDGPLLSIIMPVFNVGPYLDASITAVLYQTMDDFELIIVNDASTDESAQIIDMYSKLDARIRVRHLEYNTLGGAGIPSNIGISMARGKYIGFVDSDDFITRDAFETLARCAEHHQSDVVIGDFVTFTQEDRAIRDAYDKSRWSDIPLDQPFHPADYPISFLLSPVPWRKLYRRSFLESHQIRFPAVDHFFEDNPFHWDVLSRAQNVVLTKKLIAFHRMSRPGQTMNSSEHTFLSHFNNPYYLLQTIADLDNNTLSETPSQNAKAIKNVFGQWVKRSSQWHKKISHSKYHSIALQRYSKLLQDTAGKIHGLDELQSNGVAANGTLSYDLSVVVPAYNVEDYISALVTQLMEYPHLIIQVIVVDDGSTDKTLSICEALERKYEHLYLVKSNNKGAGRARNLGMNLIAADYVFFMDGDDSLDMDNLKIAYENIRSSGKDLLLFGYKIYEESSKKTLVGYQSDKAVWKKMKHLTSEVDQKNACLELINYPWNRIIRTNVLRENQIVFGPTKVNNDIPFHWMSILYSESVDFLEIPVCIHRKFESRNQITTDTSVERITILDSLEFTYSKIKPKLDEESHAIWYNFQKKIIDWATDKVPSNIFPLFLCRKILINAWMQNAAIRDCHDYDFLKSLLLFLFKSVPFEGISTLDSHTRTAMTIVEKENRQRLFTDLSAISLKGMHSVNALRILKDCSCYDDVRWFVANQLITLTDDFRAIIPMVFAFNYPSAIALSKNDLFTDSSEPFSRFLFHAQEEKIITASDTSIPLVTVCITNFNCADTVCQSIDSVLSQDYQRIELIVVDDASTDNSIVVIQQKARGIDRIRIIRNKENKGAYFSRNVAFMHASGEFFTQLDSDDVMLPDRVSKQVTTIQKRNQTVGCVGRWLRINKYGYAQLRKGPWGASHAHPAIATLMVRSDIRNKIGYWDTVRCAADTEFEYRLRKAFGADAVTYIDDIISHARLREGSLTTDTVFGIDNDKGWSPPRSKYAKNWRAWHASIQTTNDLFIGFSEENTTQFRQFPAPVEILP